MSSTLTIAPASSAPAAFSRTTARRAIKYVEPFLGALRLDEVTVEDADRVMASLPEHLSSSSRRHVAQVVRRVLTLAVYPARHIRENPIPRGWLPRVKTTKAFTCLWPADDANLMACRAVPLVRRLFFGVLEREGMRREEAADLRWSDVDLARGVVRLDENKTDDPRAWALDAGVAAALGIWRSRFQADVAEDAHVFRHAGKPPLRRPDGGASAGRPQGRRRDPLRAL